MARKTEQRRSLDKATGKPAVFRLKPTCTALLLIFAAQSAQANPVGGAVISGQASIANSGNTLTVTNTPGTIINWQSFSIGANEVTRFAQQSASSSVLNRVITSNPSSILGTLSSNGRVFLVNPGGVIFGKGATVDVAGLVATTLKLSDADFQAGRYHFADVPGAQSISNAGDITAHGDGLGGGQIYLIAPDVKNTGVIKAPNGEILLAAGHEVQLVNSLDPHLRANITAPAGDATNVGALIAEAGSLGLFGAVVRNSGTASADSAVSEGGKIVFKASQRVEAGGTITANGTSGGSVTLNAEPSSDPDAPGVITQTGSIRAQGTEAPSPQPFSQEARGLGGTVSLNGDSILSAAAITVDGSAAGGTIRVQAAGRALSTASAQYTANSTQGQGGDILVSANISNYTSGSYSATGATGGNVTLAGSEIKLAGAQLDASGANGGGNIHIGGLMHGAAGFGAQGVALANASNVLVNSATTLKADGGIPSPSGGGLGWGNGGQIVLWSDQAMRFNGSISARGGASGGNGGFAEVSGLTSFGYGGTVDFSAPHGASGTLLLDPQNITIVPGSAALPASSFQEIIDPNIGAGEGFGGFQNVELGNGNLVITSPYDGFNGTNSGAVYLYNQAGTLISALTGGTAGDQVGNGGITELNSGNYLVRSTIWNGTMGAVTWCDGAAGVSGAVLDTNSLVGDVAGDQVGSAGIILLGNGNYLVRSPLWRSNGWANDAFGAVTWGSGTTGVSGQVSSANSIVGSVIGDKVGKGWYYAFPPYSFDPGLVILPNDNYVVVSSVWRGGTGAVTWGNGTTGTSGVVTGSATASAGIAPSLIGAAPGNNVGAMSITVQAGGSNYVVQSPRFDSTGLDNDIGALTWMNGTTGALSDGTFGGVVSAANSLTGGFSNDQVSAVMALGTGHFLATTTAWNGGRGAVTWMNGATGELANSTILAPVYGGAISSANSLVGSTVGDMSGSSITYLSNGRVLWRSPIWNNGGAAASAGAVTWMNSATGALADGTFGGAIGAANSLVGSAANDSIGNGGITLLSGGNYVVNSYVWDNGAILDAGAVTWVNGSTGQLSDYASVGNINVISSVNSLVGSRTNDNVGSGGVTLLANGNYVVNSYLWDVGAAVANTGAVTWVNGSNGQVSDYAANTNTNVISSANSLVGGTSGSMVGYGGVTALGNGNYLVRSISWDANFSVTDAGAVSWVKGATGELANSTVLAPVYGGIVDATNSLVGSAANDGVGSGGITPLGNGHVVIASPAWNNVAAASAGAATWMNGATGALSDGSAGGTVSVANSLVGASANDIVGMAITPFTDYTTYWNYVVHSNWNGAGALTWVNGTTGLTSNSSGNISSANSLVGSAAGDSVGYSTVHYLSNGRAVFSNPSWNGGMGAVTWMNPANGRLADNSQAGAVSATNSLVGSTPDGTITGDHISSGGITEITDYSTFWSYIVSSPSWVNGGTFSGAGAVTLGNGSTGTVGAVSASNSLVGSATGDSVGSGGITVVTDYSSFWNYIVRSSQWGGGGNAYNALGAVTWVNGQTGALTSGAIGGAVSTLNSLVGFSAGDRVGEVTSWGGVANIQVMSNGNVLVRSEHWNNGTSALTWMNGATGKLSDGTNGGWVSANNSLQGGAAFDNLGNGEVGVTTLTNGNWVITSPDWGGGGDWTNMKGAATWMNGATGQLANGLFGGVVSAANSLVGTTPGYLDYFCDGGPTGVCGGITALSDDNYVVNWQDSVSPNTGAVTWGNGTSGTVGAVTGSNSLLVLTDDIREMASQPGKAVIFSRSANGGAGGVYLLDPAAGGASGPLFANSPGTDATVGASWIASFLNGGNNLILQANNDLTQQAGAGITATGSGNLTLQAGRSVILSDTINIAGALAVTANDAGANQTYRTTGTTAAVIDTTLATLTASSITFTNSDNIYNPGGDILAGTMTANSGAVNLVAAGNIGVAAGAAITATAAGMGVTLNADSDGLGDGAIRVNDNSSITSNGGDIMLGGGTAGDGTGNAAGSATYINGIYLTGATLDAGGGNIALRGTGFDAPAANGVYITSNNDGNGTIDSLIRTIGAGTITLNGDVAGGAGFNDNNGVRIGGGTSTPGSGASIASVDGLISLIGQGGASTGSSNMGIYVHNGAAISATGTGSITLAGTGGSSGTAGGSNRGVRIASGAAITSNSGNIGITGTGAYDGDGVQIVGASTVQSTSGNISIGGTGGNTTVWSYGVLISGAGTEVSSGAGMAVTGTSAATGGNDNHGIIINAGAKATSADVMALTGDSGLGSTSMAVLLSGTPAGGVVNAAAGLTVTGTGDVVVDTGSAVNAGSNATFSATNNILFSANSSLTPSAGAVNIGLHSDSDGAGGGGIYLGTSASINSNGGSITMGGMPSVGYAIGNGTVTGGVTFNSGIRVLGDITAGAGNVTMRGQGATGSVPADGVTLAGGTLSSNGTVAIDGIAQAVSFPNYVAGVRFANAGTRLSTATGTVTVTGTNLIGGYSPRAQGVTVENATIETTGSGTLTLTGSTQTATVDTNWGVGIVGGTVRTTAASGGGALTLIGTAPVGDGAIVLAGGNVTSNSGEIRMLSPSTGGIGILGGSVGGSSGNILMKVSHPSSIIDLLSGSINAGASALTLSLAGGTASDHNNPITAGALRLLGSGTFNLGGINNDIGLLATNVTGNLTFNDSNGFAIGSVTSFDGTAATTTTGVTATGNVIFNAGGAINTSSGIVTANSLNVTAIGGIAFTTQTANLATSNTGSGNTLINNTGALTVNGMSDASGSITLNNAGSVSVVGGISANGAALTNGITLSATGALSDITLSGQGGANTASGSISLNAGQDIIHTGGAQQINTYGGAITLAAGRDIVHNDAAQINSFSGALLLNAGRDILHTGSTTGQINTYNGAITLMAGRDIIHTDANQINSSGGALLLNAGRDIVHSGSANQINNNSGSLTIMAGQDFIHSASNQINTYSGALHITAGRNFLHSASDQINTASGVMTLGVGGNLVHTGSGRIRTSSSAQTITVAGDFTVSGAYSGVSSGGGQTITVGNNLTISNTSDIYNSSTGVATTLQVGNDLTLSDGAHIWSNAPLYGSVGGNVTLTGGMSGDAGLFGTPDIGSAGSPFSVGGTIRMDDGVYGGAQIHSGALTSIWIHFPNLTSGGYFVNGTEQVSSGMSGFYAGGSPAVLDSNLHITYMPLAIISQPVLDFIAQSSIPPLPGITGLPVNAIQPPNINLLLAAAPPGAGDEPAQDDPALAALAAAAPGPDPAAPPPPLPVCK